MSNTRFLTKKFIYTIYDRLIEEENNLAFMTFGIHLNENVEDIIKNPNRSITPKYEKSLDLFADLEISISKNDWMYAEEVVRDIIIQFPFLVHGTKEIRQGRKRKKYAKN